jgi:hypothetical protein
MDHADLNVGPQASPPRASPATAAKKTQTAYDSKKRYMRWYGDRWDQIDAILQPDLFVAYQRLTKRYVNWNDGSGEPGLPDDDAQNAKFAGISLPKWKGLRAKLLQHGICHAQGGRLIDPDQQKNVNHQREASETARDKAEKRWGIEHGRKKPEKATWVNGATNGHP